MGGILRPMGNVPEMLSQAILVGIILVGRLGVSANERHLSCILSSQVSGHITSLAVTVNGVCVTAPSVGA